MTRGKEEARLALLAVGMRNLFGEAEASRLLASDLVCEDLREIAMHCSKREIEEAFAEAGAAPRAGAAPGAGAAREGRVRRWGWISKRLLGPARVGERGTRGRAKVS